MFSVMRPESDPTLTTDKEAYVTGETIVFTGEHWVPGEAVTIVINRGGDGEKITVQVTADDNGSFTTTSTMAYALSHNGAPPAGYFVIGDGPVIGPKQ